MTLPVSSAAPRGVVVPGGPEPPRCQDFPWSDAPVLVLRNVIVAAPEWVFLGADYSQIEVRIAAHLSQDVRMCEVLRGGGDIFTSAASEMYSKPAGEVTSVERQHAKRIVYGILYGMGVRELAAALDRPVHSAVAVQEQFRQRFAGLARFTETVRRTCREVGYVETLFGRRRYLPLIRSEKVVERNEAERMAVNSTFQGSAADLIKLAMCNIRQRFQEELPPLVPAGGQGASAVWEVSNLPAQAQVPARLVLQIHDELVFEVHRSCLHRAAAIVQEVMQGCVELAVPLVVNLFVGHSWGSMSGYVPGEDS